MSNGEELERLAKLRAEGVLSDSEFEQEKARLLQPSLTAARPKKSKMGCFVLVAVGLVVLLIIGALAGSDKTKSGVEAGSGTAAEVSAPKGVTMAQFKQLQNGMTQAQVEQILGGPGEEMSSSELAGVKTVMYQWEGAGFGANMNVMIQNGRLVQKAQFGLE